MSYGCKCVCVSVCVYASVVSHRIACFVRRSGYAKTNKQNHNNNNNDNGNDNDTNNIAQKCCQSTLKKITSYTKTKDKEDLKEWRVNAIEVLTQSTYLTIRSLI